MGQRRKRKKRRATELLSILFKDEDVCDVVRNKADFHSFLVDSVVDILREEVDELQKKVVIFGPWDKELDFNKLDLENSYTLVQEHAPLLCQLIKGLSAQHRGDT